MNQDWIKYFRNAKTSAKIQIGENYCHVKNDSQNQESLEENILLHPDDLTEEINQVLEEINGEYNNQVPRFNEEEEGDMKVPQFREEEFNDDEIFEPNHVEIEWEELNASYDEVMEELMD